MEIKDSWFIGDNGGNVKVNAFVKNNNFFYAATEEGLKKIASNNSNPAVVLVIPGAVYRAGGRIQHMVVHRHFTGGHVLR